MGHESRIELWSPTDRRSALLVGTDRLRCEEAMKTAGRKKPNRWANASSNRAHGAAVQHRSCSVKWAAKQENVQPLEMCFLLTSPFIELTGVITPEGSGSVDGRTVALQATKPLQLSCYLAAGSGVQLSVRRVEDNCCIALIF